MTSPAPALSDASRRPNVVPVFRRARPDDLPAIIALLADDVLGTSREVLSTPPHPDYLSAFDAIDRDTNQLMMVAQLHAEVVGCLQLSFIPGLSRRGAWRGQIESVRIAGPWRASGLGRQMLQWALDECAARGCSLVQLTSDKQRVDALRFYESLGFKASHEGLKIDLANRRHP